MSPQVSEVRQHLGTELVGRTINLQDASDDGHEVTACIIEVEFEGDTLTIRTSDSRLRYWNEKEFEVFHRNEFSDPLEIVEEAEITPDGTILLIPWGGYDYVYIRP